MPPPFPHVRIAIIGAGFAGLGALIRLKQRGESDVAVLERAGEVGGVWQANRYPGAACDVESHLYSLSFAPNPHWSRRYSTRAEIHAYLQGLVERFGLARHLRLGLEVLETRWSDREARWHIETSQGPVTANVLVAAPGALSEPKWPDLAGLDTFSGPAFHTARWPESLDLRGKRVAVIGTGASAIQVVPAIQPEVSHLTLFQRTPPWVIPRGDRAIAALRRGAYARVPALRIALRLALYLRHEVFGLPFRHPWVVPAMEALSRAYLRRHVKDPALRAALTPSYRLGCKRILLSDSYYPAVSRENVTLVPEGAVEVRPHGVIGADGEEHPADVLVLATGFHVTDFPFAERVYGRGGRNLSDAWAGSPEAHVSTTVAGFPNLFLLGGPNSGLGHSSVLMMMEAQIEHLLGAVQHLAERGLAAVEPTEEAQAAFVAEVAAQMEGTVWVTGGCDSWYLDETGRNSTLWPRSVGAFRRRVAPFRPEDYRAVPPETVLSHA